MSVHPEDHAPTADAAQESPAPRESAKHTPVADLLTKSERATQAPWCWEQCGEKCDAPVIGIAYRVDDRDCKNPMSGRLEEYDADGKEITYYRETIAYEVQGCDGASASANADFIVSAANFVRDADLLLISAAADLLEAVKALLPEGWGDDDTMDHMPGVKLARAAIAKAEGR